MSGRGLSGTHPLPRLIDFAASELASYQKGCQKQQGWKAAKARPFLQRCGRSQRMSFLITNAENVLCCRTLVKPDSEQPLSYRYKLSICYWRSIARNSAGSPAYAIWGSRRYRRDIAHVPYSAGCSWRANWVAN